MQALLREWSAARPLETVPNPAVMLDQASLPWFAALNKSLLDSLDDAAFRERIRHSTQLMRTLAAEIAERAEAGAGVAAPALRRLLAETVGGNVHGGDAARADAVRDGAAAAPLRPKKPPPEPRPTSARTSLNLAGVRRRTRARSRRRAPRRRPRRHRSPRRETRPAPRSPKPDRS